MAFDDLSDNICAEKEKGRKKKKKRRKKGERREERSGSWDGPNDWPRVL